MKKIECLVFLSILLLSDARAEACVEMTRQQAEPYLRQAKEAFTAAKKFQLDKVVISPGQQCVDEVYFVVEAKAEVNTLGRHWIISIQKKSRELSIEDGI